MDICTKANKHSLIDLAAEIDDTYLKKEDLEELTNKIEYDNEKREVDLLVVKE